MFSVKINMHDTKPEEKLEDINSIIDKLGSQGIMYDYSTGLSFRIAKVGASEISLSESGNGMDGFLGMPYEDFYEFPDEMELNNLIQELAGTIDNLRLSSEEVNEFIQTGLLNMLARKNPELLEKEAFRLILKMEQFDRMFEKKDISKIPNEIVQLLERESFDNQDKQALEILKRLYEDEYFQIDKKSVFDKLGITQQEGAEEKVEQSETSQEKTGAQKIIEFMKKENLTHQDLALALSMVLAKTNDITQAQQHIVDNNRDGQSNEVAENGYQI